MHSNRNQVVRHATILRKGGAHEQPNKRKISNQIIHSEIDEYYLDEYEKNSINISELFRGQDED